MQELIKELIIIGTSSGTFFLHKLVEFLFRYFKIPKQERILRKVNKTKMKYEKHFSKMLKTVPVRDNKGEVLKCDDELKNNWKDK